MFRQKFDAIIVGSGIIGTSVTRELLIRNPLLKVALLEKENCYGAHQSGHNSGVMHCGIYYTPGTLKAKMCTEGLHMAYNYCENNQIPYKKCGKLIVAVKKPELEKLQFLFERGKQNGVKDLRFLTGHEIKKIEPNCQGLAAIWSPNTGIVDWAKVNKSYAEDCRKKGASLFMNFQVTKFDIEASDYPVLIYSKNLVLNSRYVITCGGLHSDRLSALSGCSTEPKIIPVRGDYLLLKEEKRDLVKTNIYPVPDIRLPFLDVHFTPRIDGSVWIGPNALLSFKREGYSPTDFDRFDAADTLMYRGFQKLALKHLIYGSKQIAERLFIDLLVSRLQKYVPKLRKEDVLRGPSGVRAQALSRDGQLVDDFCFDTGTGLLGERIFHVRNAPSPAATSSLAIAKYVADQIEEKFHLKNLYSN